MMALIDQLNALAKKIPREAFKAQGTLDCVTYVIVWEGDVIYAGEGLPNRATMPFERQGKNHPHLDDFIAMHWPDFEIYYAASNITKAVAVEFESILLTKLKPPFNDKSPSSIWASCPVGPDTFSAMRSAEKLDYKFPSNPPCSTHVEAWKRVRKNEIPLNNIITRTSLRRKRNLPDTKPYELIHYDSYPKALGETTSVADHRERVAKAHPKLKSWNRVKSILHWDRLYCDAEGPIITITPPDTTE